MGYRAYSAVDSAAKYEHFFARKPAAILPWNRTWPGLVVEMGRLAGSLGESILDHQSAGKRIDGD